MGHVGLTLCCFQHDGLFRDSNNWGLHYGREDYSPMMASIIVTVICTFSSIDSRLKYQRHEFEFTQTDAQVLAEQYKLKTYKDPSFKTAICDDMDMAIRMTSYKIKNKWASND